MQGLIRFLILLALAVPAFAQSRTFSPLLRANQAVPLTSTQVDGNFTGVANAANAAARTYFAASQVAMLGLSPTPQVGDQCWRTDTGALYQFVGGDATNVANWLTPAPVGFGNVTITGNLTYPVDKSIITDGGITMGAVTGGSWKLDASAPVASNGNIVFNAKSGGTIFGQVAGSSAFTASNTTFTAAGTMTVESGSIISGLNAGSSGVFRANTAAGNNHGFQISTAGNLRWFLYSDSTAESGSNAGSNFALGAYSDAGSSIDTPILINRASAGAIVLGGTSGRPVNMANKINLASIAAPSSNGDVWQDSTQKTISTFVDGVKQPLSTVLFTSTADASVANTVTEGTILGTGVGTVALPANFWVAGKTVRIQSKGISVASTAPTFQGRVKLAGATVLDTTARSLSLATPSTYTMGVEFTCRTTGVSGTVMAAGFIEFCLDSSTTLIRFNFPFNLATVNTTTTGTFDVTAQFGTASTTNYITSKTFSFEVLN